MKMLEKLFETAIRVASLVRIGECTICFGKIVGTLPGCKLACGHRFHKTCIKKWAYTNGSCPYCRARCYPHSPLITNIWHWNDLSRLEVDLIDEFETIFATNFLATPQARGFTRDYLPPYKTSDPWRFLVVLESTNRRVFVQVNVAQFGMELFSFRSALLDGMVLVGGNPDFWEDGTDDSTSEEESADFEYEEEEPNSEENDSWN